MVKASSLKSESAASTIRSDENIASTLLHVFFFVLLAVFFLCRARAFSIHGRASCSATRAVFVVGLSRLVTDGADDEEVAEAAMEEREEEEAEGRKIFASATLKVMVVTGPITDSNNHEPINDPSSGLKRNATVMHSFAVASPDGRCCACLAAVTSKPEARDAAFKRGAGSNRSAPPGR